MALRPLFSSQQAQYAKNLERDGLRQASQTKIRCMMNTTRRNWTDYRLSAASQRQPPRDKKQSKQYAKVSLLKPALFSMLFSGLGSTIKSAISLLFSSNLTLVLSAPPSFLLPQTLWQTWQELSFLSSCFIRQQWVTGHSFLSGNDAAEELARRIALLVPSSIPCNLAPLIHSFLFSDWRRTVSSKFFDTQFSSISTEKLALSRCVLSRLRCNRHSLLLALISQGLTESRILPSAPADTSHLILHCPATDSLCRLLFGDSRSLSDSGSCPASGAPWSSTMPPFLGRGPVTTTTTKKLGCINACNVI